MNKTILSLLLTSSSLAFTQTLTDKEELDNIEVIGHENSQQNIVKLLPENAQSIIDTPEVLKKFPERMSIVMVRYQESPNIAVYSVTASMFKLITSPCKNLAQTQWILQ